jgi:hypothetical protein
VARVTLLWLLMFERIDFVDGTLGTRRFKNFDEVIEGFLDGRGNVVFALHVGLHFLAAGSDLNKVDTKPREAIST